MKIYDYKGRKNISGNRIREARLKKRLSQADFAARLQIAGITIERDSVSRIEIGENHRINLSKIRDEKHCNTCLD